MGSSCSAPAREAKRGLTAKGRPPWFRLLIYAASSLVTEAAKTGGNSSIEVMREKAEVAAVEALFTIHRLSFID
jgi:hypothetical protein